MNAESRLIQVWTNPWLKKIPVRSLFATVLASIIHPALAAVGFELPAASMALGKLGFTLGQVVLNELLPPLVEAAKRGVEALTTWLEQALSDKQEVNEAAAHMSVQQAEQVAQSLQKTRPDAKEEIATAVSDGMKEYGGATAAIAEPYAAALKDVSELRKLVEEMQHNLDVWSKQTMVAKRGSTITEANMHMESEGVQEMLAEDNSIIERSSMTMGTPQSKPKRKPMPKK